ncbi:MAG: hypothetical protein U9R19_12385 [Bacteroidota bacterium]|nr:hypothetical protein [Bacteroidota bacterium]
MIRKLMVFAVAAVVLISCGGNQKANDDKNADDQQQEQVAELVDILPAEFSDVAGDYVDKEIQVAGTIVHVCEHGGKRMFVVSEGSERRVKITAGEDMAAFNTEWEGSDVVVIGTVEEFRIDEEYLAERQAEIEEKIAAGDLEHDDEDDALHTGEEGHQEHTPEDELAQLDELRIEIAESGSDHLSFYSIICKSFEVKEIVADETEDVEETTATEE